MHSSFGILRTYLKLMQRASEFYIAHFEILKVVIIMVCVIHFQSMNLSMTKILQGAVEGVHTASLIEQLNVAKKEAVKSDTVEPDEGFSNDHIQINAEEINANEAHIIHIYVS